MELSCPTTSPKWLHNKLTYPPPPQKKKKKKQKKQTNTQQHLQQIEALLFVHVLSLSGGMRAGAVIFTVIHRQWTQVKLWVCRSSDLLVILSTYILQYFNKMMHIYFVIAPLYEYQTVTL